MERVGTPRITNELRLRGLLRNATIHVHLVTSSYPATKGAGLLSTTADVAHTVPFLDVTQPGFSFDQPEVAAAQAASWYADSPLGLLVLRHAEAQEVLRDRRLDHGGEGYLERNGIT